MFRAFNDNRHDCVQSVPAMTFSRLSCRVRGKVAADYRRDMLAGMSDRNDLPFFDPGASGRTVGLAAAVCAALVASALIIMLMDTHGTESCPYWRFSDASGGYIWGLLAIVAPAAAWICYIAFDWEKFTRLIYSRAAAFEKEVESGSLRTRLGGFDQFPPRFFPHDDVMRIVLIGWCGFCAIPLFGIFYKCSGWFGI